MLKQSSRHVVMALVKILTAPYINDCIEVWGKYHCVCIIVIDPRYMPDLLWDCPVFDKLYLLSVLLDSTCNYFSQLPTTGAQDL